MSTGPQPAGRSRSAAPVTPRPAAAVPALLVFGSLYLAGRLGAGALVPVAALAGAPLVVALLSRPRLHRLRVVWQTPARCAVGESVLQGVVVHNLGPGLTPATKLTSQLAGFAELTVVVPPLLAGENAVLELARVPTARAWSVQHRVRLSSSEPFGLLDREEVQLLPEGCIVHPGPARPARVDPQAGHGEHPVGVPDRAGSQLHGLREWRPGDPAHRVHWRSTARHGRLVVVEPERLAGQRVAVMVVGHRGDDGPTWEALLARAAATVTAALRAGSEVLLVGIGPVGPATVTRDVSVALDWFSRLHWPPFADAAADGADAVARSALTRATGWVGPRGRLLAAVPDPQRAAAVQAQAAPAAEVEWLAPQDPTG